MENFTIVWNQDLSSIDDSSDIFFSYGAVVIHRDHAPAVLPFYVVTGDARVDTVDLLTAHQFAFFNSFFDRLHRFFDIDNNPLTESFGFRRANSYNI